LMPPDEKSLPAADRCPPLHFDTLEPPRLPLDIMPLGVTPGPGGGRNIVVPWNNNFGV